MGVPDNILLKPASLTDEEWEIMRKHPTFAYELLSPIQYLKSSAIDIPYCHHEKWDGTGYPRWLKKEEISLLARLLAVVYVYDALTSKHPYSPGLTRQKVLEYIHLLSWKYLDPEAIQQFLRLPL